MRPVSFQTCMSTKIDGQETQSTARHGILPFLTQQIHLHLAQQGIICVWSAQKSFSDAANIPTASGHHCNAKTGRSPYSAAASPFSCASGWAGSSGTCLRFITPSPRTGSSASRLSGSAMLVVLTCQASSDGPQPRELTHANKTIGWRLCDQYSS